MKSKQIGSSKYFTFAEYKEEVKFKGGNNSVRQKRPSYQFGTGAKYEGEWKGAHRDGYGMQVWPDGASYVGYWENNKAKGMGKFTHVDGDIYQGEWLNDKANGFGVYAHVNGA